MTNLEFMKQETLDWLLEENNPSVRYFTLVDLLGRSPRDREVRKTRNDIMDSRVVSAILSKQHSRGCWESPESFYSAKYRGTVWQLMILAELGADREDGQIKKACEFVLENSQERETGGFSIRGLSRAGGGAASGVIPCLTGNMIWSLIRLGYLDDSRVRRGMEWITTYQRFDDAVEQAPKGWPYDQWESCWGKHTCHMSVVKSLKGLSEIPAKKRSAAVQKTIEQAAEFLLKHHIHKRSHNLRRVSKPGWLKFGFPLMYQTDVLEIAVLLTKLGYHDIRMREAIELIVSKQDSKGRWKLENTYNGRFQANIEQKNRASKWITLNALRVLKRLETKWVAS
jgi:hypothetical protein